MIWTQRLLIAAIFFSVSHSESQVLTLCQSWSTNVTSNTSTVRIQTSKFPETSHDDHACYLTITPTEESMLTVAATLYRKDGLNGCSPLFGIRAPSVAPFYVCVQSRSSRSLLHLLPGQPVRIGLLNPDEVQYGAAISLSGLTAGVASIVSWESNPEAETILSELPAPDLHSTWDETKQEPADRDVQLKVTASMVIVAFVVMVILCMHKFRCLKQDDKPETKPRLPFSDNPAFTATPVPSIYDPSMHSQASLASSSTNATADQGWGIITRAGVIPRSSSEPRHPDPLPLATVVHNPDRRRSNSPLRADVDLDPEDDPRSPVIDAIPNLPTWSSPYRQKAEPRSDGPKLHPYFDPRSPVSDSNAPPVWPKTSQELGHSPFSQQAKPRDDEPKLNPYFDPRSPVTKTTANMAPVWPKETTELGHSPYTQQAKAREDEPKLNPYFDPRSPVTKNTTNIASVYPKENTGSGHSSYAQQAKPRDDEPKLNPYFDPRSPVTTNITKPWDHDHDHGHHTKLTTQQNPTSKTVTPDKHSKPSRALQSATNPAFVKGPSDTEMTARKSPDGQEGSDDENYEDAEEELGDLPMTPRKVIPESPYRPISRSSGDYGPERYSVQIAKPSGETEL